MKYGFLAPQYGLVRSQFALPDGSTEAGPGPQAAPAPAIGPKVVVKRRRAIGSADRSVTEASALSPAPKAPKVFRLEGRSQAMPASPPSAAADLVTDPPKPDSPRRRRDLSRVPTLVQHVVFEPAPKDVLRDDAPAPSDDPHIDAKALRRALDVLDAKLLAAAQAQASYRALDELLTRLGLPAKSA